VEVESKFGEGSRFIVTLPYLTNPLPNASAAAKDGNEPQQSAMSEDPSFPMIMIVDDNQVVLDMLSDFLEAKRFRITQSQSGREFLEKIKDIQPDVILMDIQMPGMDGLETIRRIRAHPNAEIASTLIIAITALAMPGDREKCLAAGANEYLSKPIRMAQLVQLIKKFLQDKDNSH
jgi:CheY-like chemotaxis protein